MVNARTRKRRNTLGIAAAFVKVRLRNRVRTDVRGQNKNSYGAGRQKTVIQQCPEKGKGIRYEISLTGLGHAAGSVDKNPVVGFRHD